MNTVRIVYILPSAYSVYEVLCLYVCMYMSAKFHIKQRKRKFFEMSKAAYISMGNAMHIHIALTR